MEHQYISLPATPVQRNLYLTAKDANQTQAPSLDASQGEQYDFVIMDLPVFKKAGFLADPRRLNVALTRARNGLIVVGSRKVIEGLPGRNHYIKQFIRSLSNYRIPMHSGGNGSRREPVRYPNCRYYTPSESSSTATTWIAPSQKSIFAEAADTGPELPEMETIHSGESEGKGKGKAKVVDTNLNDAKSGNDTNSVATRIRNANFEEANPVLPTRVSSTIAEGSAVASSREFNADDWYARHMATLASDAWDSSAGNAGNVTTEADDWNSGANGPSEFDTEPGNTTDGADGWNAGADEPDNTEW